MSQNTRTQYGNMPEENNADRIPVENFRPAAAHCDLKFMRLQSQMMDNGWQLHREEDEDDNGEEYFIHPTYGDLKVSVYNYRCHEYHHSRLLKIPLLDRDEDPKGLGCCMSVGCAGTKMYIDSNEWSSFWNTRRGKRTAKRDQQRKKRRPQKKVVNERHANDF